MSSPASAPEFVKGHGTENDFVLLPDPDDVLDLTAGRVRALCDRKAGIGADGVIRVVPVRDGGAERFFMDYYNADGSVAQMCGNGARLFARFLVDAGWAEPGTIVFTRGGTPAWRGTRARRPRPVTCRRRRWPSAQMVIAGPCGRRTVEAADFFAGPGSRPRSVEGSCWSRCACPSTRAGEPATRSSTASRRPGRCGVAAALRVDGGRIAEARVALTNMGSVPVRATGVEQALVGQPRPPTRCGRHAASAGDGTSPGAEPTPTPTTAGTSRAY